LSLERILVTLMGLGLTRPEARTYVFLAKKGPYGEKELANALKLTKQQLHRILKSLQAKGMVRVTHERMSQFNAVSLVMVLDQFMEAIKEEANTLYASREELLSAWGSMIENGS
jgi:sugar-specific transcriptional regulator TrmB